MRLIKLLTILLFATVFHHESRGDEGTGTVYVFDIKRMIANPIWRTTQKAFEEAEEVGADYIVVHMNTYGGQVDIADSIRTKILNSDIPVFVFIDNQAISAGALISIAADSIYMRPGASIGAATVVDGVGQEVPDKYQSFMRSVMRSTAEAHGKKIRITDEDTLMVWHRDPNIAQAMVDPRVYIEGITDTGEVLTLTTGEAIRYGFCEGEALSISELLEKAGIRDYTIVRYTPTTLENVILFFLNPIVSGLLIILIVGGIYFELQSPGVGFPIMAAIAAAILYFAPLYLEGIASNWPIVLFVAGIILLAIELFAIPGFGVSGVAGIVAIITGLTISMADKITWNTDRIDTGITEMFMALSIVLSSMIVAFIGSLWLTRRLLGPSSILGTLTLQTIQETDKGYISFDKGRQSSVVGMVGTAHTSLRPSGKVIIDNQIYDAKAEYGFIDKGSDIKVRREETGQLYVDVVRGEQGKK